MHLTRDINYILRHPTDRSTLPTWKKCHLIGVYDFSDDIAGDKESKARCLLKLLTRMREISGGSNYSVHDMDGGQMEDFKVELSYGFKTTFFDPEALKNLVGNL